MGQLDRKPQLQVGDPRGRRTRLATPPRRLGTPPVERAADRFTRKPVRAFTARPQRQGWGRRRWVAAETVCRGCQVPPLTCQHRPAQLRPRSGCLPRSQLVSVAARTHALRCPQAGTTWARGRAGDCRPGLDSTWGSVGRRPCLSREVTEASPPRRRRPPDPEAGIAICLWHWRSLRIGTCLSITGDSLSA